jgi:hypothetical protein
MKSRFRRWSGENPVVHTILLGIAFSAATFLVVFGGLWAFAPRVSTDDALWTAVKLAAITLGTTYFRSSARRVKGLRNPG